MANDQIAVAINADPSGLEAGMQSACQSVQTSLAQLQQLMQQANDKLATLGTNATKTGNQAKTANDNWAKSFAPVQRAFTTSINGMILGTTTWQKAVQRITQSVLSSSLDAAEKGLVKWLTTDQEKTNACVAGEDARNLIQEAGLSTGLGQTVMGALKAISASAAQAAAGAYASAAQIPYVGWLLAPAAGAAAFAAVLAFGGKMPSAAGGLWNVPSDTLAMIHKQETILPASIAAPMRNFFTGGGAGGTGGDTYAISIQAIDTQSGAQFLMNNAGTIAKGLAREKRNGNAVFRARV